MTTLMLALTFSPVPARAQGVDITRAAIEKTEDGYRLVSSFAFELNRGLEDAVMRGIPLYFSTEVEIIRPRWYWFDDKLVGASQTIRVSHDVLTRQFRVAISGGLQQSFNSLDEALSFVKHPGRWLVAENGALKPGEVYKVGVRMGLDVARLPKPFQVNALNNSDWRMSSDWAYFLYRAE